jgi:hypothetical protein
MSAKQHNTAKSLFNDSSSPACIISGGVFHYHFEDEYNDIFFRVLKLEQSEDRVRVEIEDKKNLGGYYIPDLYTQYNLLSKVSGGAAKRVESKQDNNPMIFRMI